MNGQSELVDCKLKIRSRITALAHWCGTWNTTTAPGGARLLTVFLPQSSVGVNGCIIRSYKTLSINSSTTWLGRPDYHNHWLKADAPVTYRLVHHHEDENDTWREVLVMRKVSRAWLIAHIPDTPVRFEVRGWSCARSSLHRTEVCSCQQCGLPCVSTRQAE